MLPLCAASLSECGDRHVVALYMAWGTTWQERGSSSTTCICTHQAQSLKRREVSENTARKRRELSLVVVLRSEKILYEDRLWCVW